MEWDWLNLLILTLALLAMALATMKMYPVAAAVLTPGIESQDGEVRYTRFEVCSLIFADDATTADSIHLHQSRRGWVDISYVPAWSAYSNEETIKRCEFEGNSLVRTSLVADGVGLNFNLARYSAVANNDGSIQLSQVSDL
jgi:hypothetical protein